MENYRIIQDQDKLQEFIEWLPELLPHETYYVCLLARNKYCKEITHINSDVQQLRRFTTTKERMIEKLRQMECALGSYKQKDVLIPQEALAVYIHPNPRSQIVAAKETVKELLNLCLEPYSNYNVHQVALSKIQQARGRKIYFDLDYDKLSFEFFKEKGLNTCINQEAVSVVKTHGGFHALVTLSRIAPQFAKSWYNDLKDLAKDDAAAVAGDLLLPVPGCTQGNFTPHFLTKDGVMK